MGTEMVTIAKKLELVEQAAAAVRPVFAAAGDQPTMSQVLAIANAMDTMRKALTQDVLVSIKSLENSPIGFQTDNPNGYPINVIGDAIIEGAMHGLLPINNEINIIAGKFYAAKNGLKRLVKSFPGLTDLQVDFGVPEKHGEGGALVPVRASWKLNGVPQSLDCWEDNLRIPVRMNKSMGADALMGKAERKLYARILNRVSGAQFNESDDVDVIDVVTAPMRSDFTGIGDENFEAIVQQCDTPECCDKLLEQYLAVCQCDEDRSYVEEVCGTQKAALSRRV